MGVRVLRRHLTEDEEAFIEYLRDVIEKATRATDSPMIVTQQSWATYLTWALDKVQEIA